MMTSLTISKPKKVLDRVKVASRYEMCYARQMSCSGGKVTGGEEFGRWLVGDRGALAVALRRENVWGRMRCEPAGGERPRYI
jgi:hypothetical protein